MNNFWAKVDIKGQDECWPWKKGTSKAGYGQVRYLNKVVYTHRLAWELTNGPIPDGMYILHKCDNRLCNNPSHLYLGTQLDNMRDKAERNPYDGGSGRPNMFSDDDIVNIKKLYSDGMTQKEIANLFDTSQPRISYTLRI